MTPVAGASDVGLRPAISNSSVEQLFRSMAEAPRTLSGDFRERQTEVEERLAGGDIFAAAEVLRDLAWHNEARGLTKRDMQLMQRAEELVAGEIALVRDIEVKVALSQVQAALAEAVREPLTE